MPKCHDDPSGSVDDRNHPVSLLVPTTVLVLVLSSSCTCTSTFFGLEALTFVPSGTCTEGSLQGEKANQQLHQLHHGYRYQDRYRVCRVERGDDELLNSSNSDRHNMISISHSNRNRNQQHPHQQPDPKTLLCLTALCLPSSSWAASYLRALGDSLHLSSGSIDGAITLTHPLQDEQVQQESMLDRAETMAAALRSTLSKQDAIRGFVTILLLTLRGGTTAHQHHPQVLQFDARTSVVLRRLALLLRIQLAAVAALEEYAIRQLQQQQDDPSYDGTIQQQQEQELEQVQLEDTNDEENSNDNNNMHKWIRHAKIGAAAATAGGLLFVTGGFAAPALAAGLSGLGLVSAATFATSTMTATLLGTAGASLTAYRVSRRMQGLTHFEFQPINNESSEKQQERGDAETEMKGMTVYICVSGQLREGGPPTKTTATTTAATDATTVQPTALTAPDFYGPWGAQPPHLFPSQALDRFYALVAPGKRAVVPALLQHYAGREPELFARLHDTYHVDPNNLQPEKGSPSAFLTGPKADVYQQLLQEGMQRLGELAGAKTKTMETTTAANDAANKPSAALSESTLNLYVIDPEKPWDDALQKEPSTVQIQEINSEDKAETKQVGQDCELEQELSETANDSSFASFSSQVTEPENGDKWKASTVTAPLSPKRLMRAFSSLSASARDLLTDDISDTASDEEDNEDSETAVETETEQTLDKAVPVESAAAAESGSLSVEEPNADEGNEAAAAESEPTWNETPVESFSTPVKRQSGDKLEAAEMEVSDEEEETGKHFSPRSVLKSLWTPSTPTRDLPSADTLDTPSEEGEEEDIQAFDETEKLLNNGTVSLESFELSSPLVERQEERNEDKQQPEREVSNLKDNATTKTRTADKGSRRLVKALSKLSGSAQNVLDKLDTLAGEEKEAIQAFVEKEQPLNSTSLEPAESSCSPSSVEEQTEEELQSEKEGSNKDDTITCDTTKTRPVNKGSRRLMKALSTLSGSAQNLLVNMEQKLDNFVSEEGSQASRKKTQQTLDNSSHSASSSDTSDSSSSTDQDIADKLQAEIDLLEMEDIVTTTDSETGGKRFTKSLFNKKAPVPREEHVYCWRDSIANYGDQYTLIFDPETLLKVGRSVDSLVKESINQGIKKALKLTALSSVMSAVAAPLAIVSVINSLDDSWTLASAAADEAGLLLADALLSDAHGNRPVVLIGYSMGGRVVAKCLLELAAIANGSTEESSVADGGESRSYGEDNYWFLTESIENDDTLSKEERQRRLRAATVVRDAVIIGAPVDTAADKWALRRSVVSGRLVNVYCPSDWVLSTLYRFKSWSVIPLAGLKEVKLPLNSEEGEGESGFVGGVENFDVADIIECNGDYPFQIQAILQRVAIGDVDCEHYHSRYFMTGPTASENSLHS